MRRVLHPLKLPGFAQIVSAYSLNELGNWLGEVALAVLVFEQTGSPIAAATLFLGMQFLPGVLGQIVVVRAEMAGARRGLPLLYLAEGVTFLALALTVDHFVLGVVVALAAIDGTLAIAARAFTRAAAAAVLTPAHQLRQGNALINIGFTGAGALGPALAGAVVAAFGIKTALLVDAGSFGIAALLLIAARSIPDIRGTRDSVLGRLKEGVNYVRGRAILLRLLVIQAIAFVFFSSIIPVEIVYATDSLNTTSTGYGMLLAAWGVGMVVGGLVFAGVRSASLKLLILVSTAAVGVAYLGMAVAQTLPIACVVAGVGGVGNGVQWVSIVSAVQELTTERFQARVLGLLEASGAVMPGVGFVLGGLLAQEFTPRTSFAVAGIGVLVVVGAGTLLFRGLTPAKRDPDAGPEPQPHLETAPTS